MWQIDNRTPFAAAPGWIRDLRGAEVWVVVIKATYDVLANGSTSISSEQPAPLRVPEYHGKPVESSVRYESDFVLMKRTTDLLIVGHAVAPSGRPCKQLDVGFRIGDVKKSLRVFGDRIWGTGGPGDAQPFTTMPLIYERSFGGVDRKSTSPETDWEWRNPVGCGYAVEASHLMGCPLPNLESQDRLIQAWDDRPDPAGFGVVASHWQPRAGLTGTFDTQWEVTRQPLLPEDFDERFFQCAPSDQQAPSLLTGGEPVTLLNMSPSGRLDFLLPKIEFSLETAFSDGDRVVHAPPKLHSVIIEPNFPRVSLVWHSSLACHEKVYKLDFTRIRCRHAAATDDDASVESLLDLL